jgi:hypothetical protein
MAAAAAHAPANPPAPAPVSMLPPAKRARAAGGGSGEEEGELEADGEVSALRRDLKDALERIKVSRRAEGADGRAVGCTHFRGCLPPTRARAARAARHGRPLTCQSRSGAASHPLFTPPAPAAPPATRPVRPAPCCAGPH